jgi:hypothetical protein
VSYTKICFSWAFFFAVLLSRQVCADRDTFRLLSAMSGRMRPAGCSANCVVSSTEPIKLVRRSPTLIVPAAPLGVPMRAIRGDRKCGARRFNKKLAERH